MKVSASSDEYASAETMLIDEGGIDLFIDGECELSASFEHLDPFELAYRVLPEDFELIEDTGCFSIAQEYSYATNNLSNHDLESLVWLYLDVLATRRGISR